MVCLSANINIDSLKKSYELQTDPKEKIKILLEIVNYNLAKLNQESLTYLNIADSIANKNNLQREKANIETKFAIFWRRFASRSMSIICLNRALNIYQSLGDSLNMGIVHRELGESYRVESTDSSLYHLKLALKIFTKYKDTLYMAKTLNRFSAIYQKLGSGDKCIEYANKSLNLLMNRNDDDFRMNNYIMLIAAYRDKRDFDKAHYYEKQAFSELKHLEDYSYVPSLFGNLARLATVEKKPERVIELMNQCIDFCKKNDLPDEYYYDQYNSLAIAYEFVGNYKKAYETIRLSSFINKKVKRKEIEKQILGQQLMYETKQKDQELTFQKTRYMYQFIIFIIAFIFIGIIIYIILKRNRDIKNANSVITSKNDQLEIFNKDLHELNATKDKFFSIIAHDLKNPIGSFKQMTEVLSKDYSHFSENEKIEFIESMKDSSKDLFNLLENLLSWSRSQQGSIKCNLEPAYLSMVVSNTFSHLSAQSKSKNIELQNKIPNELRVKIDANLTSTVIRNFVSNSIKYSNENSSIEVFTESFNNEVVVVIKDYGIGMDTSTKDNLFRIDSTSSKIGTGGEKGTGLGLIVCKEFIEKQGGRVWVESELGKGSAFKFTVPE